MQTYLWEQKQKNILNNHQRPPPSRIFSLLISFCFLPFIINSSTHQIYRISIEHDSKSFSKYEQHRRRKMMILFFHFWKFNKFVLKLTQNKHRKLFRTFTIKKKATFFSFISFKPTIFVGYVWLLIKRWQIKYYVLLRREAKSIISKNFWYPK